MSYTIQSKCSQCELQPTCVDEAFVNGAISGIHQVNGWDFRKNQQMQRGHKGSGTIELKCTNFQQMPDTGKSE